MKRVGLISLIALVIGLIGAHILAGTFMKPIQVIVQGMRNMAAGRLEPTPELNRRDELGWMAHELNTTIVKLQEVDRMKKEITAAVTHELRSPLLPLERLSSLILENTYGPLTNELRESILIIKNNTTRLSAFIDDLLAVAKLESRKDQLYIEDFDICSAISEAVALYEPAAKDKKISLVKKLPAHPLLVHADHVKTHQVLTNLLSNALKFTVSGGITVEAAAVGGMAEIRIRDTGAGIPAADKAKIFEPFYRVPQNQKVPGTGLGLSIVKGFVELQKGRISVDDNPGGGTVFILSLPLSKEGSTVA